MSTKPPKKPPTKKTNRGFPPPEPEKSPMNDQVPFKFIIVMLLLCLALMLSTCMYEGVDKGEKKVGYLFGAYHSELESGAHFPVNPFVSWTSFDLRQRNKNFDNLGLPSRDNNISKVDISVQYVPIGNLASFVISNIGTIEDLEEKHLVPKTESLVREQGKTLNVAEDIFNDVIQINMQESLATALNEYLNPMGLRIMSVLIKEVSPPDHVQTGIIQKKLRDQEAEKEISELRRFTTEQQKQVEEARAKTTAAEAEAKTKKLLADAEAYSIEAKQKALANSPEYLKFVAIQTLGMMAKDPAAKFYFIDPKSTSVLPLLNLDK